MKKDERKIATEISEWRSWTIMILAALIFMVLVCLAVNETSPG
jgi:hypothetical protein